MCFDTKRRLATGMLICFVTSLSSAQEPSVFMGPEFPQDRSPMGQQSENFGYADIGRIVGTVVGAAGRALADVLVQVRNISTGSVLASAYTNRAGIFRFEMVPNGRYEVVVANNQTALGHELVEVRDSSSVVNLQLNNSDLNRAPAGNGVVSVAEYQIPAKARTDYDKAEKAFREGRLEDVSKYLEKALQVHPGYAAALTLRGMISVQRNDLAAAINDFNKAIRSDSDYARAYGAMAVALNGLSRFDEALRAAQQALSLSPSFWQADYEMAKSYVGKADYQRALQQLNHVQGQMTHNYAPLHLLRARAFLALKNYSDAAAELKFFLGVVPANDARASQARDALAKINAFLSARAITPTAEQPQ